MMLWCMTTIATLSVHQDYSNNFMPSYPSHMINFILGYEFEISKNIDGILAI